MDRRSPRAKALSAAYAACAFVCAAAFGVQGGVELPPEAHGTFVQRKTLADVGVTLTSRGEFRFERDRFFEFDVREPMPSVFRATPTNYSVTVNGRTTSRALDIDVTSIGRIFEIREMKEFVKSVKTEPETGFPRRVRVTFRNGDRLEIDLNAFP